MTRFAALTIAALIACAGSAMAGSLWDYVHRDDPTFAWQDTGILVGNATTDGWQGYLLNVTSQTWLTAADTDHPVWSHQLVVIVPNNLNKTYTTGAIYVTGGGSGDGVPTATDEDILVASILAVGSKSICAVLFQVPNQPLVFAKDPEQKRRSEDDVVAFSWWLFLQDPSRTDLVVFNAMVKSVSKAMDAFQEYVKVSQGIAIEKFVIAGASKRGWTTWLTGAVDERVVAIAPIVMDMLNFVENVNHMYQAYGGWTFAFESYYNMNITLLLNSPAIDPLIPIIDPLQYAANLTMPKLIIDSTGDEFFMPDDDHYWWGQLPGETYRLMVSNAEHSMATGLKPVLEGMIAFYQSILMDTPRPSFTWTIDATTGNINVVSQTQPNKAVMRTATTWSKDNGRRDFRLVKGDTPADPCDFIPISIFGKACLNPVFWIGEDLLGTQTANGWEYTAFQPMPPANFWRGFFVDMYYPGPAGTDFRMTTQVSIIPQTFPFPACQGDECRGVLV